MISKDCEYSEKEVNISGESKIRKRHVKGKLVDKYIFQSAYELTNISLLSKLNHIHALSINYASNLHDISALSALTNLEELTLQHCTKLDNLSPISKLTQLKYLNLEVTNAAWLFRSDDSAYQTKLDLQQLETLSDLKYLSLAGRLCDFDLSVLRKLRKIETLDLGYCEYISNIQPLNFCTNLKVLNLQSCSIRDISLLEKLSDLRRLDLSYCTNLINIESLKYLINLEKLDLYGVNAAFECSPKALALDSFVHLETLYVSNLSSAPQVLCSADYNDNALPRIRRWQKDLKDLVASGPAPEMTIKVFILGNGRVGKTQLRRRLTGQSYDESVISTHGIEVENIVGDYHDESGQPLNFKFWDFGGQDIYLSTHAMFLDDRAICVIAWHPDYENNEEIIENGVVMRNRPLNYWLEYVRNHAGTNTPVILVQTQCEQQMQCRDAPIFREHGFTSLQRTHSSAIKTNGLDKLIDCLVAAADYLQEKHGRVVLPQSWVALSNQLQARREEKVLFLQAFQAICETLVDVDIAPTLTEYLHRNGEIFWQQKMFNGQIVLDFSWCFAGIYALFHRECIFPVLLEQKGQFTVELLKRTVWADYSEREQQLFLDIMQECNICFELTKDCYISPQALPVFEQVRMKMNQVWQDAVAEAEVKLEFPFLSEAVVQHMIAQLGKHARESAYYWAYGSCFYDAKTKAKALITTILPKIDSDDTLGYICIQTAGGQAQALAEYLVDSFTLLNPLKSPTVIWKCRRHQEGSKSIIEGNEPFGGLIAEVPKGVKDPLTPIYINIERFEMKKEKNTVTQTINISDATINAPITIAENIQDSFNTIKDAGVDEELESLMLELLTQIAALGERDCITQVEEISEDAKRLSEELARDNPRRRYWEISIEGIQNAAKAIGEIGVPIFETTTKLLPLLTKIFPG